MARKPPRETPREAPQLPPPSGTDRDKIVEAFMALLAERPFEDIGFGDIAARAGLTLAQCRAEFASTIAVLGAHIKEIDRKVLAGGEGDMAEEPPRERLFDVLMRRLEVLAPYRAAVRSLMRSAYRNPGLAMALNSYAVRSQQWMLTAADIDAAGTSGLIRAQGLALLYARVMQVWLHDEDPGLARTLAALDRELARGQRWAGFLDDLCRLVPSCRRRERTRHRERDGFDEQPAVV
jgi:AcrR family transcriptional regulator